MAQTFGRPKSCINVNLNKIQNTVNEFQIFLSDEKDIYFEKKKEKVKCLIEELQKLVIESDDKQIQTDVKPLVDCQSQTDLDSETLLEYLYQFNDEDKVYIISKGWSSIEDQNKLVIVYDLINKMEHEMQCDLYTLLGNSFNEILLKYTQEHHMDFNHMTIQNLTKVSRGEIYNKFDQRLVSFFDAATFKTYNHTSRKTHNNLNEKSNIVESMLKAIIYLILIHTYIQK